jgi:saccharopine dehydrogenase (NAD+, L-lysine-forming)
MKALIVGTGGVGESMAAIAKRRDPKGEIFTKMVLADYDRPKAQAASSRLGTERFPAEQVDAFDTDAVVGLAEKHDVDVVCNLLPVYCDLPMMKAALKAKRHYLDTGMTDDPDPLPDGSKRPFQDQVQFDYHDQFVEIGKLALLGHGIEPGMVDYFARYAADHYFDEVEEMGVRDGCTLELPGHKGMAFVFDPWSTMDECTEPAIVWEADKGFTEVEPFSDLETFTFPRGIGPQQLGNVQHDEVIHIARNAHLLKGVKKASFKYGVGAEFIDAIEVLKSLNLTTMDTVTFKGKEIAPRDFVAAVAPDPAELCKGLVGLTSSGLWVKGKKDGLEREVYLYQVADAAETMAKWGTQVITCQTAFTAVITLELLDTGNLAGYEGNPESGVRSPEEFHAEPYIALMATYEFPGGLMEMDSEYKRAQEHAALTMPLK